MTESPVRLDIGSITRKQLESAIVRLSQLHQPANKVLSTILTCTTLRNATKRVQTFTDQIKIFEGQLKGCSLGMDLTRLIKYGQGSISVMKRSVVTIVKDMESSIGQWDKWGAGRITNMVKWLDPHVKDGDRGGDMQDQRNHAYRQDTNVRRDSRCHFMSHADDLELRVRFIPWSNCCNHNGPNSRVRVVTLQKVTEQERISRFRTVRGRMDEVFGLNEWNVVVPSVRLTKLNTANVAKLPRDDKCQDQPKGSTSSDSDDSDYGSDSNADKFNGEGDER